MAYRTQRSARESYKFYRCLSWPLTFSSIHALWWEIHLICEWQVALNNVAFLVSEVSVFDKFHTTCLVCVHVYVERKITLRITPQNVIVVESQKFGLPTTKNIPFILKSSLKWANVFTINKAPIFVLPKVESALHWQLPRKSSCCVPIYRFMVICMKGFHLNMPLERQEFIWIK